MLLELVSPGAYETLYDFVIAFLKQIPTVFKILTAAPTSVNQILVLVVMVLSTRVIFAIADVVKAFFGWLNEKL